MGFVLDNFYFMNLNMHIDECGVGKEEGEPEPNKVMSIGLL